MTITFSDFHLFCGAGGGALGFSWATRTFGPLQGRFRSLGGIDSHPRRCADFALLMGRPATCMDLFSAEDYAAFHGRLPPEGWREATPADVRAAAGGERPDVVFTSAPCKGFSGLLSGAKAESPKYQALNRLTLRGLWLALEAWADDPPGFIVFENVPRIVQRGRHLLEQITGLLRSFGYAVQRDAHDCGELGGLAQHRNRFLLLARHIQRVRPFLYRPELKRVRSIGEVVGPLVMPEHEAGGPMHRLPRLRMDTLVRLALIPAGKDWRALKTVDHTQLRMVPVDAAGPKFNNCFRIVSWGEASPAVTGGAGPSSGGLAVADPRVGDWRGGVLGVQGFDQPSGTVAGQSFPTNGAFSVADPRLASVMSEKSVTLRVKRWSEPAPTVTGNSSVWDSGGFAVGDPRLNIEPRNGTLGVQAWDRPGATVTASLDVQAGPAAVQDPRKPGDAPMVIIAQDETWHRPLTAWELAALQSFPLEVSGRPLVFAGSPTEWREAIGNAVPPAAARAVAEVLLDTLLQEAAGVTFALGGGGGIWVNPDDRIGRAMGWEA